jgi:hypothetical protein
MSGKKTDDASFELLSADRLTGDESFYCVNGGEDFRTLLNAIAGFHERKGLGAHPEFEAAIASILSQLGNKQPANTTLTALGALVVTEMGRQLLTSHIIPLEALPTITAERVGADAKGTAATALRTHEGTTNHPVATTTVKGLLAAEDKLKLDGIQNLATQNATDAQLRDRATHTGTQPWTTISDTPTSLAGYGIRDAARLVNGVVPTSLLPNDYLVNTASVATQADMLALPFGQGDFCWRRDVGAYFDLNGDDPTVLGNWRQRQASSLRSINTQTGPDVVLGATDVGADPRGTAAGAVGAHEATVNHPAATPSRQGMMAAGDKSKLDAIQPGATVNATDAQLRDRSTHTGTQPWNTISGTPSSLTGYGITDGVSSQDSRLTNARTPTSHSLSHAIGGTDAITPANIGAEAAGTANTVVSSHEATTNHPTATAIAKGFMSAPDKSKLDGIETGATANASNAQLRDRSTHTGTQHWNTISNKPTTVEGYGITNAVSLVDGVVPSSMLPNEYLVNTAVVSSDAQMQALNFQRGDYCYRSDVGGYYDLIGTDPGVLTNWQPRQVSGLRSVNRQTGPDVMLGASDVGADPAGTAAGVVQAHEGTTNHPVATPTAKGMMAAADKSKLEAIQSGATVNATDAQLRDRATHTGTQSWNTIANTPTTVSGYGITDAPVLVNGALPDTTLGNRTVDQALPEPANTGTLTQLLGWIVGRIRAVLGTTNWTDAPPITLQATSSHVASTSNPHNTTAAQVGAAPLVHNQAWSTITNRPTTVAGYGITDAATLVNGLVPTSLLPNDYLVNTTTVATEAEMLGLTSFGRGDFCYRTDVGAYFDLIGTNPTVLASWQRRQASSLRSINTQTGPDVVLGAADVGAIPNTANSVTDGLIGGRTVDPALATPGNTGTITQILSWITGRIRALLGTTNWTDAPPITLQATSTHVASTSNPHATTAAQVGAVALTAGLVTPSQSLTSIRCKVSLSSNLSVSNGTFTPTPFGTINWNSGITRTSSSRYTIATAGGYQVNGFGVFSYAVNGGDRYVGIRLNGTTMLGVSLGLANTIAGDDTGLSVSCDHEFAAGDYLELVVWQFQSPSATAVLASASLSIRRVY